MKCSCGTEIPNCIWVVTYHEKGKEKESHKILHKHPPGKVCEEIEI